MRFYRRKTTQRSFKERRSNVGLLSPSLSRLYLLPSWKSANSSAVLSSTVRAVTVTGPLALLGKQPCSLTSCQSEWILQISTESKYLRGDTVSERESVGARSVYSAHDASSPDCEVLARRLTGRRRFRPPLICIHGRHLLNSGAEPLRAPPHKHHLPR